MPPVRQEGSGPQGLGPDVSATETEMLDLYEAQLVRFCYRLGAPSACARPGATKVYTSEKFNKYKFLSFSYQLDRRSLYVWKLFGRGRSYSWPPMTEPTCQPDISPAQAADLALGLIANCLVVSRPPSGPLQCLNPAAVSARVQTAQASWPYLSAMNQAIRPKCIYQHSFRLQFTCPDPCDQAKCTNEQSGKLTSRAGRVCFSMAAPA